MNHRFFYTDPLAAAWMMKHHGMRFFNHNNGAEISLENILRHALTGNFCGIYIHPDSQPHLGAQLRDLVTAKNKFAQYLAFVEPDGLHKCNHHSPQVVLSQTGDHPFGVKFIVERNGKAFHWPESEEA